MQLPKPTITTPAAPPPAPPAPVAPKSVQSPQGPGRRWIWLVLIAIVAAAGALLWQRNAENERKQAAASVGTRTFTVSAGGSLERVLRLTGATGPEKFSSLLTPQLRGSRSGGGMNDGSSFRTSRMGSSDSGGGSSRGGGSGSSSGGSGGSGGSVSSGGGSSSGSGDSSSSTASMGGGSSSASSSTSSRSSGGSMSAAMRSATSRVGGSSSRTSTTASSSRSTSSSSSTMGDGLGSSSSTLPGGGGGSSGGGGGGGRGGGGGGMSEFMMVLQDAAKPGSLVKKGDKVAEFDRQYMLNRLDDYRASVTQAEASYKKMLSEIDVNKQAHNQTIANAVAAVEKAKLDMKTVPVMSAMDSERLRLSLEEAEARLKQLREEVRHVDVGLTADKKVADLQMQQSQIELRRAEMNANRMEMKAPIDGLVVFQNIFRGGEMDQIKVGDQLFPGMMFLQIVDTSSMIINANVSQADVEKLRIGQKARVRFDAFPDLTLPGHIYAIGAVAKASRFRPDWVKEMAVVLKLDQMDKRVIPDLSVSCDIILETADSPALVPRESVFTSLDGRETKPFVYVRAGQTWERRNVETGIQNHVQVSVKSGLKLGDVVALETPRETSKQPTASAAVREAPRPDLVAVLPGRLRRLRS